MVEIELDGKKVEVAEGSMVMHAADKAGTYIPHFCYHKKLSIAANCRMCLVDIEKMPKPMPACATPVTKGMIVRTRSEGDRRRSYVHLTPAASEGLGPSASAAARRLSSICHSAAAMASCHQPRWSPKNIIPRIGSMNSSTTPTMRGGRSRTTRSPPSVRTADTVPE